jgi:hypothetical protein
MNEGTLYPGISTDMLFIAVSVIAAGLGIYGLIMVMSLSKITNHIPHGQQVDKFMIGVFNITISMLALYLLVMNTQTDTNQLILQTNRLLGQIK